MRSSNYFIVFNGVTDIDIGLSATKRPNIINPQQASITEKTIEGRDETVTVKSKTLKNIEIPIEGTEKVPFGIKDLKNFLGLLCYT